MKTARRRAREFAIQGIYQSILNPGQSAGEIENHLKENDLFNKADATLFTTLLTGVLNHAQSLTERIVPYYEREPSEVSPIERSILLMAALELIEQPETPYPVVINEAIEITKTFGSAEGHKFVNGVLDKLAAEVRANEMASLKAKRR